MTYLCEDSRRSERTSRKDVKSCSCGADESGEHCGLWEKKGGGKKGGGKGGRVVVVYISVNYAPRNGNQTPSVGNQPRINKSQAPHLFTRLIALAAGPARATYIHHHQHALINVITL